MRKRQLPRDLLKCRESHSVLPRDDRRELNKLPYFLREELGWLPRPPRPLES